MVKVRARLLALASLWIAAACAAAQAPTEGQIQSIRREILGEMERKGIPGLSAAIALEGNLAWSEGFGFSDLENRVAATAKTVYRLASISKSVSAVAALRLWEEGKLDLDAPVQTYCKAFPEKSWPVTTRQLLGHLSGIRHYKPGEIESTKHYASLTQALEIFKDDPLAHRPGEKYTYTTYGYTLLGCVLEGASGQAFADHLDKSVMKPARLDAMRVDDVYAIIPNRAQGYSKRPDGALRNSGLADTSYKIPGGGLCATTEDLARFAIALMGGTLLKPETLELAWTPQKLSDGSATGYGLGFGIGERNGFKVVSHTGSQQRVNTVLLMVPAKKLAVAVMCNLEGSAPMALARRIATILAPDLGGGRAASTARLSIRLGACEALRSCQ